MRANPADFGAQVGEATERAGGAIQKVGDLYGRVAADDATTSTLSEVSQILHGVPGKVVGKDPDGNPVYDSGYLGLKGADAMSAREGVQERIDDAIQHHRDGLWTTDSQEQFDNETRRYRAQWLSTMGDHLDQQQQVWGVDVANKGIMTVQNSIVNHLGNPDLLRQDQEQLRKYAVRKAQLEFGGSDDPAQSVNAKGAILQADQTFLMTQLHALTLSDPASAQKLFDASRGVLGSLPDYDQIGRQVKEANINAVMTPAIDRAVVDAGSEASRQVTGGPSNPNNLGNVKGAGGGFAAPATPVDGALLAADNLRSGYRGLNIQQIASKWAPAQDNNNPAQWANTVSRVSGIPVGTVPDLNNPAQLQSLLRGINAAEKSGTDQALFTPAVIQQGVTAALAGHKPNLGAEASATRYPSMADALMANQDKILQRAQGDAERLFPNYPDAQERYVQGVERRLDQTVSQLHRQYEVDGHVVQEALASNTHPTSEADLEAMGPQVANAWQSMKFNNPLAAMHVENMFDANAKGRAVDYGTNFSTLLSRALLPATDGDRISSPSQLWAYVQPGNNAPLTNTGAATLANIIAQRGTPQGEALSAQLAQVAHQWHGQMTFSNSAVGVYDKKGEAAYSKFMAEALPVLLKGQQNGTLPQMLNPKSPDYIGNLAHTYMRAPADVMKDQQDSLLGPGTPVAAMSGADFSKRLDHLDNDEQRKLALRTAVQRHMISLQDGTQIGIARGYIQGPKGAPQEQLPTVPVPDSAEYLRTHQPGP